MAHKHSGITGFAAAAVVLLGALVAIVAVVVTGAPNHAGNGSPQSTGSITGKILFQGTPPERRKLNMSADPVCAARNPEPVLAEDGAVNSNGTLPNAFVYLKNVSGSLMPPATPVVLDQKDCMYLPHVLGVMVGHPLKIVSSDPTTHNIHFMSTQNPNFNQTQPPGAPALIHKFMHAEIMITVHCNEHPWMSAYLAVTSNPFYTVTGAEGTFTIKNVPPGEYTLASWTATFGTQDQKVAVRAGQSTEVNFTFKSQ